MTKTCAPDPFRRASRAAAIVALLLAGSGCGPVFLKNQIDGLETDSVTAPSLVASKASQQPFDTQTLFEVTLTQPAGRDVRFAVSYQVGSETPVPIAPTALRRWDGQALTAVTADPNAPGQIRAASAPGGAVHALVWDHSAAVGAPEVRDAKLLIAFGDTDTPATEPLPSATSLDLGTVGRDTATLHNPVLARQGSFTESPFVLTATLRDWGDDFADTLWIVEYNLDGAPTGWVTVPGATPDARGNATLEPDGRIAREIRFVVDPFDPAIAIPQRILPNFQLRARADEPFGPGSRFPTVAPRSQPTDWATGRLPSQVGVGPLISEASIRNPGVDPSDPRRPWFALPITLQVAAGSARPVPVAFRGEYRLPGRGWQPMTLYPGDRAESQLRRTFFANRPEAHYLLWNVVNDVGLGIRAIGPSATSAETRIIAAVDVGGSTGQPIEVVRSLNLTNLITTPFADFRTPLVDGAGTLASGGALLGNTTRDIFYTVERPPGTQERELRLEQQFRAVQLPSPEPVLTAPLSNGGITRVLPTDFIPGEPDCIFELADNQNRYFFVSWPQGTSTSTTTVPRPPMPLRVGNSLSRQTTTPPVPPIQFELQGHPGAVFLDYILDGGSLTLQVNLVRRDAMGSLEAVAWQFDYQLPTLPGGSAPPIDFEFVPGPFDTDGDPATFEFVVGNLGAEYGGGLLHLFRVRLQGGQLVLDAIDEPLPAPPLPRGDPARAISSWHLCRWLDDSGLPAGLVLVRTLDGTQQLEREHEVLVLPRSAASGAFGGWLRGPSLRQGELLSTQSTSTRGGNLAAVFAADLDGSLGGRVGSDLLLVFTAEVTPATAPRTDRLEVWVYSQNDYEFRNAIPLTATLRPDSIHASDGFALVDVNGDDALDLLVKELGASGASWTYVPSTLTAIPTSFGEVSPRANASDVRSRQPAVIDIDRDGYADILTGGRLYSGRPNGEYEQVLSTGFPGAAEQGQPGAYYLAEQVFLDGDRDAFDFVIYDPDRDIDSVVLLGAPDLSGARSSRELRIRFAGQPDMVRPVVTADTATTRVKDLVATVPTGTGYALFRARFDGLDFAADPQPLHPGPVLATFARVRRGALDIDEDVSRNTRLEDLVVIEDDPVGGDRVVLLDGAQGFAARPLHAFPVGEDIVGVQAASVSDDTLEDLLVLTCEGSGPACIFRVHAFEQNTDPTLGLATPRRVVELLRFQTGLGAPAARAFAFDRTTSTCARGLLLIEDAAGAAPASELRVILPFDEQGDLGARLIRSSLARAVADDLSVVVTDTDRDGLIEAVGGTTSSPQPLQKLDRGFVR